MAIGAKARGIHGIGGGTDRPSGHRIIFTRSKDFHHRKVVSREDLRGGKLTRIGLREDPRSLIASHPRSTRTISQRHPTRGGEENPVGGDRIFPRIPDTPMQM